MQALGGRSLTWLAGEIGAAVSTVSGYAKGKVPPGLASVRIADVLGVDLVWYLTGKEPASPPPPSTVRIERIRPDGTGAGTIPFDAAAIAAAGGVGGHAMALTVEGSAMAPTAPAGSDVLFAVRGGLPADGRIHVLKLGGRFVVRRIQALASGGFLLVCDNPSFPAEAVSQSEGIEVVGRVFAVIAGC